MMMQTRRLIGSGLVTMVAIAGVQRAAFGQTKTPGTFTGVVTRDTLGHGVSGAEIALPGLRRTVQTTAQGEFRFADVPAGKHLVIVRAIGFSPFADSILVESGATLDADLTLTPSTMLLDTLRTTASRTSLESRSLEEFESRRKVHAAGAFISDSALRANESSKMSSLIARLPGIHTIQGKGMAVYIASAVATTDGRPAFLSASKPCYVTVYLDGVRKYQATQRGATSNDDPPDFQNMRTTDFAGVEYYASASMAPAEFSVTGSDCGVMLLWSRRDRLARPEM